MLRPTNLQTTELSNFLDQGSTNVTEGYFKTILMILRFLIYLSQLVMSTKWNIINVASDKVLAPEYSTNDMCMHSSMEWS